MMKFPSLTVAATALVACACWSAKVVVAEKDSSYFPPGYSNPNIKNEMYWRDAINVLQDLSSFDKLYVQFHSCVWSPYANGCGEESDAYSQWYMGHTHCFRANAAYSLYGILKGNSDKKCGAGTYINSFFTSYGIESFTPVIYGNNNNDQVTSDCQAADNGNDDGGYSGGGGGYGGGTSYANKGENLQETSYAIGCYGNEFVKQKFRGSTCDGKDILETMSFLDEFNDAMEAVECVQVYSGGSNDNNGDNNNNNEGDGSIASDLLSYSQACSIREFPTECPDPYGKLIKYTRALECATGTFCLLHRPEARTGRDIASAFLILGSLAMVWFSCTCKWNKGGKGKTREQSHLDLIRSASSIDSMSQGSASTLSRVASSVSKTPVKVMNAIQNFAEAEVLLPDAGEEVACEEVEEAMSTTSSFSKLMDTPTRAPVGDPNMSTPISGSLKYSNYVPDTPAAASYQAPQPVGTPAPEQDPIFSPPVQTGSPLRPPSIRSDASMRSASPLRTGRSQVIEMSPMGAQEVQSSPQQTSILNVGAQHSGQMVVTQDDDDQVVANSMLADKAMMEQNTSTGKRYKRPVMARVSKRLFGWRKKRGNSNAKAASNV